jgi:hypothetical protein
MDWFPSWRIRIRNKKREAQSEVNDSIGCFEESVMAANAVASIYDQALVTKVRARFDEIKAQVEQTNTEAEIDNLVEQADGLLRLRAYLYPQSEILIQAQTVLNTLEDWSIPASSIQALKSNVLAKISDDKDLNTARGALHTIFEEYDDWSDYLDEYDLSMTKVYSMLAIAIVVSLGGAIYLLQSNYVLWALLIAGACGAFVSVISKSPTLVVSGDSAPYIRGVWRRSLMGLAASVMGIGFLVSGLITITLPNEGSLPDIIENCSIGDTCKKAHILVLVALAMLFGFSERALTSFEEKVFPSKQ